MALHRINLDQQLLTKRPQWPFTINTDSSQSQGLLWWAPMFGDAGGLRNLVRPATYIPVVGGAVPVGTRDGIALNCNAVQRGVSGALPAYMNALPRPISMVAYFYQVTAGTDPSGPMILTYTNADTAPYVQYGIGRQNATTAFSGFFQNSSSSLNYLNGTIAAPSTGALHCGVLTCGTTAGDPRLYLDGIRVDNGTFIAGSDTVVTATAGASPLLGIGTDQLVGGGTRNCGAHVLDTRFYNRVLPPGEVRAMWDPPTRWALYRQPSRATFFFLSEAAGGVPAFRLSLLGVGV